MVKLIGRMKKTPREFSFLNYYEDELIRLWAPHIRRCEPQQSTYMFWSPQQSHIWEPLFPFCCIFSIPSHTSATRSMAFWAQKWLSSWSSFPYVRATEILSDVFWAPTVSLEWWSAAAPAGSTWKTDISLPRQVITHSSTKAYKLGSWFEMPASVPYSLQSDCKVTVQSSTAWLSRSTLCAY